MSIKKYSSGSWVTVPYRKYETATDTITSFPADVIADGQSASAVIKGNLSQSGTPTPSSPIYPNETGDLVASGEHLGQYQIPISSGGTTTNVYLGEVQTTRKIKKLVLTGDESDWERFSLSTGRYFRHLISSTVIAITNIGMCSHYVQRDLSSATINTNVFTINAPSTGGNGIVISPSDTTISTADDFMAYLAQQYSNGTPVTVWYVLVTPTTTTLNEPIRKIGSYSDSVSVTGIPTTGTAEQFDVDTDLKPSEVSLMYHGWHEQSDTKY